MTGTPMGRVRAFVEAWDHGPLIMLADGTELLYPDLVALVEPKPTYEAKSEAIRAVCRQATGERQLVYGRTGGRGFEQEANRAVLVILDAEQVFWDREPFTSGAELVVIEGGRVTRYDIRAPVEQGEAVKPERTEAHP